MSSKYSTTVIYIAMDYKNLTEIFFVFVCVIRVICGSFMNIFLSPLEH
jgi:hypothetical protein